MMKLSDVKAEKIKWLWPGFVPRGRVVIIEGDPGLGKSLITVDWIARVTSGAPWPDGSKGTRKSNAIVLSAEDDAATDIKPRVHAAGGDPGRVLLPNIDGLTVEDNGITLSPEGVVKLRQEIISNHASIVVVDVLMAYMQGDANRDQTVRKMLTPLTRVAMETDCTIVLIRHLTKTKNKNAKYRGSGSIGILGAARMSYVLTKDEDTGLTYFLVGKINHGAPPLPYIVETEEVPPFELDGVEYLDPKTGGSGIARIVWKAPLMPEEHDHASLAALGIDAPPDPEPTEQELCERRLLWVYRSDPDQRARTVDGEPFPGVILDQKHVKQKTNGFSKETLRRAKKSLGIRTEFHDDDGEVYWRLPLGLLTPLDDGS
jgi:KaiC/GvpD/RAD55 family RecA-like ATPase